MVRLTVFLVLVSWSAARADELPLVGEADWTQVRRRCAVLVAALQKQPGALPADVEKQLAELLERTPANADAALEKVQRLLDPLCLAGVHINPESRVKAARGEGSAELTVQRPRVVLLKVHNEAGITPPLNVSGNEGVRWLEVTKLNVPALKNLNGQRLEYVAVLLTARESGKREVTLKFDAGQGTQDLGFRAEVPVLFRIGRQK